MDAARRATKPKTSGFFKSRERAVDRLVGGASSCRSIPEEKGNTIATRRTTYGKRDRELAKKNRAAAKRERRAARAQDESSIPAAVDNATTEDLLQQLKQLHDDFDADLIAFDDFDVQKQALLARIADGLAQGETTTETVRK